MEEQQVGGGMWRERTGIAGWIAVLQQRVPSSTNALTKARFQGTLKPQDLDSLTCYIQDHIAMDLTLPGIREYPEKVDMKLSTNNNEALARKRLHQQEAALLEVWLDNTLKYSGLPLNISDPELMYINSHKGLQEYGLSRRELLNMGLSQNDIERAYRMLYVYSIALRAEVAELLKDKEQAQDELKFTRKCLNEALDNLSLASLKLLSMVESSKQEAVMIGIRNKEVADAKQELKDAKDQVATMKDQYSVLTKEAQNSMVEVCECCRAAQLQESLTEEKAQVQQLKMSNMKLQDDIQMKNKWQHLLEVKIDALEEEGAKLKAEWEGKVNFMVTFDNETKAMSDEISVLRETKFVQAAAIGDLNQQLGNLLVTTSKLQAQLKQKSFVAEQQTQDLQLTKGEQVAEWIRGHEMLLLERELRFAEQEALTVEIIELKRMQDSEKGEREKERRLTQAQFDECHEIMRILTFGLVVIATTPSPVIDNISLQTSSSSSSSSASSASASSSSSSSSSSPSLSNSVAPPKAKLSSVVKTVQAVQRMHNTLVRKRNSTRMDELLQQFKVTQFENELLNAKIGLLMGEIAELTDKNVWLEVQASKAFAQLGVLQFELEDTNERLGNVAREKTLKTNCLWVAEEEIEELRIELMDLKDKMRGLNSEKMHLENALVQEKEQTNTLDSLVAPTLETARTSAIYQAELQAKQDTILELELKIEEYEAKLNDMMNDKNELGVKVDNLIKEKTELQLLMSKEKSELQSELQTRNYQLQSQLKDMEEKLAVMESGNCEGNNHDEEDSESANLRAQLEAMKKEMGSLKGT
ncbi:unnamed protein product [Sphagnum jensenii]|uniref:Calponin-homology (CH) domain-containing protein n=1 Tax=Sphagnum jensenii TaxID=128206 RepID=A0ABP0VTI3_9BRYO